MKRFVSLIMFAVMALLLTTSASAQSADDPMNGWKFEASESKGLKTFTHDATDTRIEFYTKKLGTIKQAEGLIAAFFAKLSTEGTKFKSDMQKPQDCGFELKSAGNCQEQVFNYESTEVKDLKVRAVSFATEKEAYFAILYYTENNRDLANQTFNRQITELDDHIAQFEGN